MSDGEYTPMFDLIMGRMRLTDAFPGAVLENTKTGERFAMTEFTDFKHAYELLHFVLKDC